MEEAVVAGKNGSGEGRGSLQAEAERERLRLFLAHCLHRRSELVLRYSELSEKVIGVSVSIRVEA
tara:strand:+ start:2055 stop:2249 length:195 start_codon:yes stop_codon:yes gene_type:complete